MKLVAIITLLVQQMINFFPFNFGPKPLPARFDFMPRSEQVQFVKTVTEYVQTNHPAYKLDFAEGRILGEGDTEYGLDNLAQQYHQAKGQEKQQLIPSHFEKLLSMKKEEEDLVSNIDDFEKIKKHLTVRLFSDETIVPPGSLVSRDDFVGIKTVLVFDLPSAVKNVRPEDAKLWGKKTEELFTIALENTLDAYKPTVSDVKLSNSVTLRFFGGDNIFIATNVFDLDRYPEVIGKQGALVILPHRQAMVVFPINDLSVIKAMSGMAAAATGMYKEGPGSISPNLFWYHDGKFTKIPYDFDGKKAGVTPPDEFVQMLNELKE